VRVVAGSAKGRRLKSPPKGVRPTSDLVRGAIFDALEARGADLSQVLDLYAGSGALGIEAMSRGGGSCDFVERSQTNVSLIRENLVLAGVAAKGRAHKLAAERAAGVLEGPYTLVLADPPYDDDAAVAALAAIAASPLVTEATTLVIEGSSRAETPEQLGPLSRVWDRRYGDTQVAIYHQRDSEGEEVA
jgi:16S rRNA (guanine966-N2)-methyltransferase